MNEVRYSRLRPEQFDERLKKMPVCFIPLGSLEWHYLHLPLGTDGIEAEAMCAGAARKSGGIVFPPVWLSITGQYRGKDCKFYRNIKVSDHLFEQIIDSIIKECIDVGFKMVLLACGHGATSVYEKIAYKWFSKGEAVFCAGMGNFMRDTGCAAYGDHAAFFETSYTSFLSPESVDLNRLKTISGNYSIAQLKRHYEKKSEVDNNVLHNCYILGLDPRLGAGKDHGKEIAERINRRFAEFVEKKYCSLAKGIMPAFDLPFKEKNCWIRCPAYNNDFIQKDGVKRPSCLTCSEASMKVFYHLWDKWGKDKAPDFFKTMLTIAQRSPLYFKTRIVFLQKLLTRKQEVSK